jgi:hypothetical protein
VSDQRGRVRDSDLGAALAVLEAAFGPVEVLTVETAPGAAGLAPGTGGTDQPRLPL